MNIITTQRLTRRYGRRIGIDQVDLTIPEGEIFGFLGPNGAGKTTTIRLLLGFLKPSDGCASIFGLDCWRASPRIKREVGYLPGDLRLYSWLTGRVALRIFGKVRRVDLTAAGTRLADRFRLDLDLSVRKTSRGMRQKLGIILALVHRPRLLVLDEPTSGLDPLMQQELANCLREMAAQGHTVFFSSHTLSEVEQLCDRVAIVRDGRIVADESLESLRSRARRTVVLFFKDPETASRIQSPEFLTIDERNGNQWHCELTGTAGALIRWAADQPIDDISIGQPDLESLFRKFYQSSRERA